MTSDSGTSRLSTKDISPSDRLIFALDVASADDAHALVEGLGDSVGFYKVGLELCMAGGYFELLAWLRERGKKVFADLKFYDIPQTVGRAVARLSDHDVQFCTVHGDRSMIEAAVKHRGEVSVLAVTVLTSLDENDLREMGYSGTPQDLALQRARTALESGCDGVISSGLEAPTIRAALGYDLIVVCPGVRPAAQDDDQKRVVTVEQAFLNGADHIVVGRPIRDADDPRRSAVQIQEAIAGIFT
jgi:orotidine-5'-phosphate decarboxylase